MIQFFEGYLQTGTDALDLVEWFVASSALVIVVTLIYVFVLGRAPPPEGLTEAKLEMQNQKIESTDVVAIISEANTALANSDFKKSVELSVKATSTTLSRVLTLKGGDPSNMNISDMAYIIQSKSPGMPDITQPAYQLNQLHLKIEKGELVAPQEASWAISTATWFSQVEASSQI